MHAYVPQNIDYEALRLEKNPLKNFQAAFKAAQSVGVPQSISIQELLNNERPEWHKIMNYVASLYKHFEVSESVDSLENGVNKAETNGVNGITVSRSPSGSPPVVRFQVNGIKSHNSKEIVK